MFTLIRGGESMRTSSARTSSAVLIIWMVATLMPAQAQSGTLLSAACDPPAGFTQNYGVTGEERAKAKLDGNANPPPTYKGQKPERFGNNLSFVVDSDLK